MKISLMNNIRIVLDALSTIRRLVYVCVSFFLLILVQCNQNQDIQSDSIVLTTPEKDAQIIVSKVPLVRTEEDLRNLEILSYEYEKAYEEKFDGATALYFRSLVEQALIEAAERRDQFREEEDYLAEQESLYSQHLDDIDKAWNLNLQSLGGIGATIRNNDEQIAVYNYRIEILTEQKSYLADMVVKSNYAESTLEEWDVVNQRIEILKDSIMMIDHDTRIIKLAYRLQYGEEWSNSK